MTNKIHTTSYFFCQSSANTPYYHHNAEAIDDLCLPLKTNNDTRYVRLLHFSFFCCVYLLILSSPTINNNYFYVIQFETMLLLLFFYYYLFSLLSSAMLLGFLLQLYPNPLTTTDKVGISQRQYYTQTWLSCFILLLKQTC